MKQCEDKFGEVICNTDKKWVPVRSIAEQHIREDLGFIPSIQDWFREIKPKPWMVSTRKNIKKMNLM